MADSRPRAANLADCLRTLRMNNPDVEASAIVSPDGLTIAADLPSNIEEDRVSALSAAMLSLGDRIASELQRGVLEQVYIRGNDGYVLLMAAGDNSVLTALARKEARLGLVLFDLKRAAAEIAAMV